MRPRPARPARHLESERTVTQRGQKTGTELVVITKAYDLVRELTRRVRRLPRDARFVLGDRIIGTACDVLDTLIEARYEPARAPLLRRANVGLERLRFQVRLCADESLISLSGYEHVSCLVDEVGRLVGGWERACRDAQ